MTFDFQKDISPVMHVSPEGLTKVRHMRALLESVAVPWNVTRHSSELAENPGGNVRKEAYEDLLEALRLSEAPGYIDSPSEQPPTVVQRAIKLRRGQAEFRQRLMEAYEGRCAVTGSPARAVLEAAHITPFSDGGPAHPSNGLLLRSDIHTLFDLRLIAIDIDGWTLLVHPSLSGTEYWSMRGSQVTRPSNPSTAPDAARLAKHRKKSGL